MNAIQLIEGMSRRSFLRNVLAAGAAAMAAPHLPGGLGGKADSGLELYKKAFERVLDALYADNAKTGTISRFMKRCARYVDSDADLWDEIHANVHRYVERLVQSAIDSDNTSIAALDGPLRDAANEIARRMDLDEMAYRDDRARMAKELRLDRKEEREQRALERERNRGSRFDYAGGSEDTGYAQYAESKARRVVDSLLA